MLVIQLTLQRLDSELKLLRLIRFVTLCQVRSHHRYYGIRIFVFQCLFKQLEFFLKIFSLKPLLLVPFKFCLKVLDFSGILVNSCLLLSKQLLVFFKPSNLVLQVSDLILENASLRDERILEFLVLSIFVLHQVFTIVKFFFSFELFLS